MENYHEANIRNSKISIVVESHKNEKDIFDNFFTSILVNAMSEQWKPKQIPKNKKIITYIRIKIVYDPVIDGKYHDNVTGKQFVLQPNFSNLDKIRNYINSQHKTVKQAVGHTRVSLKAAIEFKIK